MDRQPAGQIWPPVVPGPRQPAGQISSPVWGLPEYLFCPPLVEGQLYRSVTDPIGHVYVARGGALHWIPDPDTLVALGYGWSSVQDVSQDCLNRYPIGAPLPHSGGSAAGGSAASGSGVDPGGAGGAHCPQLVQNGLYVVGGQYYAYLGGLLHYLPDLDTLHALGWDDSNAQGTTPLCVDLAGVGQAFGSLHAVGDVAVLVQEYQRFASGSFTPPPSDGSGTSAGTAIRPVPSHGGLLSTFEANISAHKQEIVVGLGALVAWRMGLFRALLGGRR